MNKKICKDHLGNVYKTKRDMCNFYGINVDTYNKRISYGYSVEDALTLGNMRRTSCKDHLGNEYESINEMCRHYGINKSIYMNRIKLGWSIEDILTHDNKMNCTSCKDHFGNEYASITEMCRQYGITVNMYKNRIKNGATLCETLTVPRNLYIGEYRVAECLKRLNIKFYHDCSIKTIFTDLGLSVDWDLFLVELQSHLGSAGYNWSKQKIQRLRPDFVLYTDEDNKIRGVIEFDGEQHQNFVEYFFKTIEEFYRRSNADFVKQTFWEYMSIPMLRIRHDQIDMIDDMVKDFIDNPQNYIHNHNTYLSETEYWSILSEQKAQLDLAFAV